MPVIQYNAKNTHTVRTEDGKVFRFLPGVNEVPDALWDELKEENSAVQNLLSMRQLEEVVVRKPKEPGKPQKIGAQSPKAPLGEMAEANIATMDAWAASALVTGCIDVDHLKRFAEQEEGRKGGPRKMVGKALAKALEAATAPLE